MDENRFAPVQLLIGVAGLVVAVWGLIGAPDVTDSSALRWAAIGVVTVLGVVLIAVGGFSRRER